MTNQKVSTLFEALQGTMINLYGRWQDEQEYEDIKDYAQPLEKRIESIGAKLKKMTKRPFGFIITIEGAEYQFSVTSKTYSYKRIK